MLSQVFAVAIFLLMFIAIIINKLPRYIPALVELLFIETSWFIGYIILRCGTVL